MVHYREKSNFMKSGKPENIMQKCTLFKTNWTSSTIWCQVCLQIIIKTKFNRLQTSKHRRNGVCVRVCVWAIIRETEDKLINLSSYYKTNSTKSKTCDQAVWFLLMISFISKEQCHNPSKSSGVALKYDCVLFTVCSNCCEESQVCQMSCITKTWRCNTWDECKSKHCSVGQQSKWNP